MKKVIQYSLDGEKIAEYKSCTEAGLETGVKRRLINDTCKYRQNSAGGFRWEFAAEHIMCYSIGAAVPKYCGRTVAEAQRLTGLHKRSIRLSITTGRPTQNGFLFKREALPESDE